MNKTLVIPSNLELFHSGKVRDTAFLPNYPQLLLQVASDRISTHNVLHNSLVPDKGELLTALMLYWALRVFHYAALDTHLVACGRRIYEYLPSGVEYDPRLHYRAVVVKRLKLDPVELIWRNRLTGSLEALYRAGEDPHDLRLPGGLLKMHDFGGPVFTPTDKSETDRPLPSKATLVKYVGAWRVSKIAFTMMNAHLAQRGITLVDAKFEAAESCLADEWGTGDCCRMAWTKDVKAGKDPPSLDKQIFREGAVRIRGGVPRNPVTFSDEMIKKGLAVYHEAFEAITGGSLSRFQYEYLN